MTNNNGVVEKDIEDQKKDGDDIIVEDQKDDVKLSAEDIENLIEEEEKKNNSSSEEEEDYDDDDDEDEGSISDEDALQVINDLHGTNYRSLAEARKSISVKNKKIKTQKKEIKRVVNRKEPVETEELSFIKRELDEIKFAQKYPDVAEMTDIMDDLKAISEIRGSDLETTFKNSKLQNAVLVEKVKLEKLNRNNNKIIRPSDNIMQKVPEKSDLLERFPDLAK